MLPRLDDDVLDCIVLACTYDYPTLLSLLTVSKSMFRRTVKVMYASFETELWSAFSKLRLEYLLILSSGYCEAVSVTNNITNSTNSFKTGQETPVGPKWPDAVRPPLTIPYFDLVRVLPQDFFKSIFSTNAIVSIQYHGRVFSEVMISRVDFSQMKRIVDCLPNMNKIYFNDLWAGSLSMTEQDWVLDFVQAHLELFPGKLQSVRLNRHEENWALFLKLQKMVNGGKPTTMQIEIKSKVFDLNELPVENVKHLKVDKFTPVSERNQVAFFSRSRALETLDVRDLRPGSFEWARIEQERYQERIQNQPLYQQQQQQRQQQEQQQHHHHHRLQLHSLALRTLEQPLIQLKKIVYHGSTSYLKDLIFGFQHSLEHIEMMQSAAYETEMPLLQLDTCILPRLHTLEVLEQCINTASLILSCPTLRKLKVNPWRYGPQPPMDVFPLTLRSLTILGEHFSRIDVGALKGLILLEDLVVREDEHIPNDRSPLPLWTRSDLNEWHFPRMKKAIIVGSWTVFFQGTILRIAPRLETLYIGGLSRSRIVLNMKTMLLDFPEVDDQSREPGTRIMHQAMKTMRMGKLNMAIQSTTSGEERTKHENENVNGNDNDDEEEEEKEGDPEVASLEKEGSSPVAGSGDSTRPTSLSSRRLLQPQRPALPMPTSTTATTATTPTTEVKFADLISNTGVFPNLTTVMFFQMLVDQQEMNEIVDSAMANSSMKEILLMSNYQGPDGGMLLSDDYIKNKYRHVPFEELADRRLPKHHKSRGCAIRSNSNCYVRNE